jgi:hypothetical protein
MVCAMLVILGGELESPIKDCSLVHVTLKKDIHYSSPIYFIRIEIFPGSPLLGPCQVRGFLSTVIPKIVTIGYNQVA